LKSQEASEKSTRADAISEPGRRNAGAPVDLLTPGDLRAEAAGEGACGRAACM